jgi:Cu/Ag efflux protein CusF
MNGLTRALIIIPLLGVYSSIGAAEPSSVLDPAQHPKSPEYQSTLGGSVVPLDSKLSWSKRFNGDESFNSNRTLVQTNSAVASNSSTVTAAIAVSTVGTKMDARGVVKAVRESKGKIKIKHGPIDKYGMPGMSMMFKVLDPTFLVGLKKGQNIGFNIDNSSGGFVITRIMPTDTSADVKPKMTMDATGVVKAIRESQGKIKIKHGPINKYGMPGMSMMFKVSDPSSLESLKKGQNISFNIDNSSGGFVITHIVPTDKNSAVKHQTTPVTQVIEGTWFVQLIAYRSLEEAEDFWQRTRRTLPALEGKSPLYQKSENIVRLLIGPGQSRRAASQLCQKLKQADQDCFIRSV